MDRVTFLPILGLVFLFSACGNNARYEQREIISGMEKTVEKNTNDQFLRPLVANYIQYAVDFKEDAMTPIYLYRCAVLYYRANNFKEAIINLEKIVRDYPNTEILEDTYLLLAMISATGGNNMERAKEIYSIYKEKYPNGKGIAQVDYFFKPASDKLADHIKKIQDEIAATPRGQEVGESKYSQLMYAYANFIKAMPNDPLVPSYCLQGAQLAIRLGNHFAAVEFLDKIYQDFPDFSQYPEAMLLLAVEYDTHLTIHLKRDRVIPLGINARIGQPKELIQEDLVAKGGEIYRQILKRYPNHDIAKSAQAGLQNLGKKTNAVVEEFLRVQDSIKQTNSF